MTDTKKKILIISNTYYQLIMAVQLKLTVFHKEDVDIWLSDESVGAEAVCGRLKGMGLFSEVCFKERKRIHSTGGSGKRSDIIKYVAGYNFGKPVSETEKFYDEILFYNLDLPLYGIADYYAQQGHACRWSQYDEGILSYERDFVVGSKIGRLGLTQKIRSVSGRPEITRLVDKYYCMFPEMKKLHKGEWEFVKIPPVSRTGKELRGILNQVFDYKAAEFSQKYIFFASSHDIDGHPIGETELILKIADQVGVDNLLVKQHPRDARTVYQESGIRVMKNSFVPWEIMHMNLEDSEKVLLTTTSSAFLGSSAMLGSSMKAYFLSDCLSCQSEYIEKERQGIRKMVGSLHKNGLCGSVQIYGQKCV